MISKIGLQAESVNNRHQLVLLFENIKKAFNSGSTDKNCIRYPVTTYRRRSEWSGWTAPRKWERLATSKTVVILFERFN